MEDIKFYKVNDNYGYFSNFAPYPIFIEGELWQTSEHYFQCSKFEDETVRSKIKKLTSPMEVAIEGRNKKNLIRSDWDFIKESIMYKALKAKFLQHPELKSKLLETGKSKLIEHTSNDSYWGDSGNGQGKNRLGELLMSLRDEINNLNNDIVLVLPPWIAFPNISQYDIFWQMGLGANYLEKWAKYYLNLPNPQVYQEQFIPHSDWSDIYE